MKNLIDAYNGHDVEGILKCMTPDCIFRTPDGDSAMGDVISGTGAIAQRTRDWFDRFPDSRWTDERHELTTDGRGITSWVFEGTDSKTGQFIRRNGCDIFEFRDAKVAIKDTYRKSASANQSNEVMTPYMATERLGPPAGRYVHAMRYDRFLFVSGMAPVDSQGVLVAKDIEGQTQATLENMRSVLALVGAGPRNIVKETIFLTDVAERFATHAIREAFYGDHIPASTLIGVKELVVPGMRIEIDAIAAIP